MNILQEEVRLHEEAIGKLFCFPTRDFCTEHGMEAVANNAHQHEDFNSNLNDFSSQ